MTLIRKHRVLIILISLILVLYINDIYLPCLFHEITGFYCPGCGVTRMLIALFHLEFKKAFFYNRFVFILLILYLCYLLINTVYYLTNNKLIKIPEFIIYILIAIAIIFGILRNIPLFNYLRP